MDPTARFFSKLRKLSVTLETETEKLKTDFENRNNNEDDDDDSETTARAMRAYHEMNCDVGNMKGQIQEHLAQQKARESEVSSFIKSCRVMKQRVTQDIQTLRGHWEKYGYQAPQDTQKQTKAKSQGSEAEDEAADEDEANAAEEEGSQEEARGDDSTSPSNPGPPPFTDVMRTPQLSDFGLSEMQLKRALAGAAWCAEVPPMPEMSLPHPALSSPAPPPMPLTPKCALRMDDDELQTPQMHDFGISEHTMCLNNDFTMDLFRKNVPKPQRASQDMPAPPGNSLMESLQTQANKLESPEAPVFCTPGFKIKKTNSHCTPQAPGSDDPGSPTLPENLSTTPEVPAFQTPYVNRLVSSKKRAWQDEPIKMQTDDDSHSFELQTTPPNGTTGSKRTWEYNVPDISITGAEDKQMPEMPNLESLLGNTLQSRSAKMQKKTSEYKETTKEPTVKSLELDGHSQEFSLRTPNARMDYEDPSTPEMPDLSSVTQDICKLLSEAQKKKTAVAVVNPNIRPEKDRNSPLSTARSLPLVSESEFQSLPSYLKQMTLSSLNQAVHSINRYSGEQAEFQMEELRRITNVGPRTPVYILCLTELKRLKHVGGARNTSVYTLSMHN
ncbi:spindle and kinetochore-associated protein 3 [Notolabrus celidotus]|uniref:spindle and kinetochore-associated protein 3 n=1 Tax=Notolabrus celidotus TaxID=1203425 RepID=UPI00148FE8BC|nr:spindle and kinetochore-associated protein 3 [Notolabrus celidotus]XP_034550313.1 spindle and kinetochore-associated protein 3 [Notolabrus celidotus]